MPVIDLRSDTVTRPTSAMRAAMANAEVGDDVYGEDPTVNRLEAIAAEMLGKEAAIFVPSGTQANLLASLTHCQRGDETIVGQMAHTYRWEGGGAAVLGSIQPQPLDFEPDGTLDLDQVARAIKPDDVHFARTRLLCLENTQGGKALPMEYLRQAAAFGRDHGLVLHLDGARIFNAAVKHDVPVEAIARHFDSVSFCVSKGLGAPVGSLFCAGKDQIERARRWRKMLGGGMRQAGIVAAGAIYALENHVHRLAEDHANAALLAGGLAELEELRVDFTEAQTNMVFVRLRKPADELAAFLEDRGVRISAGETLRLVTHLDVREDDVGTVVASFKDFFPRRRRGK
jgi:threonine aldolase